MAVAENGHIVKSEKERHSGHANGHVPEFRRRVRSRTTWSSWMFSNVARLSLWYAIITIIFRCPSNPEQLSDQSPRACSPYFTARDTLKPYAQPYYEHYAQPYVEKAKPYIDSANTYAFAPAYKIASTNFEKYAVPQLEKAKVHGYEQWDQHVRPQLGVAQQRAISLYNSNLEQHVAKASSVVTPYYEAARGHAREVHQRHIIPTITNTRPHLETIATKTQIFMLGTALPTIQYTWANLVIFLDGTLWPFIKNVYSDNVRPQLVMISERIAKYQESRKLQAVVDAVEETLSTSSLSSSVAATTASSVGESATASFDGDADQFMAGIINDATSVVEEVVTSVAAPQPKHTPEVRTDEIIQNDLANWQKKFAAAADTGADDLRDRVKAIVNGLVRSDIDNEGRGLVKALELSCDVQVEKLKSYIQAAVEALPENATEAEQQAAEDAVLKTLRASGVEIKDRAKKVRDWAQRFQHDLATRITLAAKSTVEILGSIRDLGLQEIGMRWAWMQGVSYKDWEKFHSLRQKLDDWKDEIRIGAVQHPAAEAAKSLANIMLEESMATTENAAKELFRLKDVAKWKIRARDATDNFEDRILPAAIVSAASKAAAQVEDFTSSIVGTTQGTIESIASAASTAVSDLSATLSSRVVESASSVAPVVSDASSLADGVVAAASSAINSAGSSIESFASEAGETLSEASASIVGTSTGTLESFASQASSSISSAVAGTSPAIAEAAASSVDSLAHVAYDSASSLASAVSSAADSLAESVQSATVEPTFRSVSSVVEDVYETVSQSASSVASAASKKVFAGAMAQEVNGQVPILDDTFDDDASSQYSGSLQSIIDDAGDQYAEITKAISEALYGTSKGQVESLTSLASEQYQSALSAASLALYGTPTPAYQSAASMATDRYKHAVAAASSAIFASKQPPIADSLLQQASLAYSEAVSRAAEYRSAAEDVVSKQMLGTPKPIHSQMIESISGAYAGSVAQASARLDQVLKAAAGQYSSLTNAASAAYPTQGRLESVSSVASSRLQIALDAASSQLLTAKMALGATPTPVAVQAQQNYYAAIGYAHEQYSSFVAAGSSAVYGTPTPAYQNIISQASSRYSEASVTAKSSLNAYLASLSSVASQATKTKGPAQNLLEQASSSYSSMLSVASGSFLTAAEQASLAVLGSRAPAYQQAVESVGSQYAAATSLAASNLEVLLASASAAVGKKQKTPAQSVLDNISSRYSDALIVASSSLAVASSSVSSAFYGPAPGSFDSMSSVASSNWQELVSQASDKIYGQPTPVWAQVTSQVQDLSAQATDAAAEKYVVVQHFISELIVGKEPEFTASVMSRLSSAYYIGVSSSAVSLASEAYASGASIASSISSVASAYFTPPPELNSILDNVNSQLNAAVEAASAQVYGTSKGVAEQAASAAADAYSSASSAASEAVYGTPVGYGEAASSSIANVAQSASEAISIAIWGTSAGQLESASSAATAQYERISSVVASSLSEASAQAASAADVAKSKVSEAIYGPEQGALESAQSRILEAVESAKQRIASISAQASAGAEGAASWVSESAESVASVVSESVSSATAKVKDEL